MPYTIAVDFDGCLCENKYPKFGKPNKGAIAALRIQKAKKVKVILWTCREGKELDEAVSWCAKHQLTFDAVNDNLPEHIKTFGNNSRKVHADEYWDDKSVLVEYEEDEEDK